MDQSFEADTIHVDNRWTPYAYRPSSSVSGVALAQTLTVGRDGNLVRVSVRLAGDFLRGDLPIEIRRGGPNGALIASETMAEADVASPGWLDVWLDATPPVHRGEILAIVLPPLAPNANADVAYTQPAITWVSSPNDDPGYVGGDGYVGDRFHSDPGVSNWDQYGTDRHFRTYVCSLPETDTETPLAASSPNEPASAGWAFIAFGGVLGLALSLRRRRDAEVSR